MTYECLLFDISDRIATLTLNRPERLNALGDSLRDDLYDALQKCAANPEVGVIIITGAGRGFCSGGDVKTMKERAAAAGPMDRFHPMRDVIIQYMRELPKPIIAAINGVAAGAGWGLAFACDMRIASTAAKFSQAFVKRGLTPDWGGTHFLARAVGTAKACELIFTGDSIDAAEAYRLNLVNALAAPEELMNEARKLATKIANGPPLAIAMAKRSIYHNDEADLRSSLEFESFAQGLVRGTEDNLEGIKSFMEKRAPVFKGR